MDGCCKNLRARPARFGNRVPAYRLWRFVELLPGVDGLIHLSECLGTSASASPATSSRQAERVDVVVLQVNPTEKRISLGLKQTLGDPWEALPTKFPVGSQVEGPVT